MTFGYIWYTAVRKTLRREGNGRVPGYCPIKSSEMNEWSDQDKLVQTRRDDNKGGVKVGRVEICLAYPSPC